MHRIEISGTNSLSGADMFTMRKGSVTKICKRRDLISNVMFSGYTVERMGTRCDEKKSLGSSLGMSCRNVLAVE
jgi:hypothetical protein